MDKPVNRKFLLVLCALLSLFLQVQRSVGQDERPARVVAAKQKAGQCTMTIFEAPRLRGFYLYQPEQEVSSALPSFHKAYQAAKEQLLPQRDLISDFREVKSDDLEDDLTAYDNYRDVSFVWQFLYGHVVQLRVTYSEYEPRDLNDFVEAVASTTNLPFRSFRVTGKHTAVLRCDGFSVELKEGSYKESGWVPGGSQIILTDTESFAMMDAEEKEVKKIRAKEAAQRKADQEKQRHTFKP